MGKAFENTVGKGENASNQHISFSYDVFYSIIAKYQFFCHISYDIWKCSQFESLKFCRLVKSYPFPNKSWFLHVCSTSLLQTLWKEENCSRRAIPPFPTVFLHIWRPLHYAISIKFNFVVCKFLHFGQVQNTVVW